MALVDSMISEHGIEMTGRLISDRRREDAILRLHQKGGFMPYSDPLRAVGTVVARLVHTEEVTGSNPVPPTTSTLVGQVPLLASSHNQRRSKPRSTLRQLGLRSSC